MTSTAEPPPVPADDLDVEAAGGVVPGVLGGEAVDGLVVAAAPVGGHDHLDDVAALHLLGRPPEQLLGLLAPPDDPPVTVDGHEGLTGGIEDRQGLPGLLVSPGDRVVTPAGDDLDDAGQHDRQAQSAGEQDPGEAPGEATDERDAGVGLEQDRATDDGYQARCHRRLEGERRRRGEEQGVGFGDLSGVDGAVDVGGLAEDAAHGRRVEAVEGELAVQGLVGAGARGAVGEAQAAVVARAEHGGDGQGLHRRDPGERGFLLGAHGERVAGGGGDRRLRARRVHEGHRVQSLRGDRPLEGPLHAVGRGVGGDGRGLTGQEDPQRVEAGGHAGADLIGAALQELGLLVGDHERGQGP